MEAWSEMWPPSHTRLNKIATINNYAKNDKNRIMHTHAVKLATPLHISQLLTYLYRNHRPAVASQDANRVC
jgi:hypothetical protein